jgi:hypothetical protein
MWSKFQCLFPHIHFASSPSPFSRHRLWPSHFCQLTWVRKHLWQCKNDGKRLPCSSVLHHCEFHIEQTYRIRTMLVCTQLHDWILDTEQGMLLVETVLPLQAGASWFRSSLSLFI